MVKRVWGVVCLGNCKLKELTLPKYHSLAIFNPGKNIRLKEYKGKFIILLPRAVIKSGDWIESKQMQKLDYQECSSSRTFIRVLSSVNYTEKSYGGMRI